MVQSRGKLAHKYWQKADYSRLAPANLYNKQCEILTTYVLPYFRDGNRLLDIGCSDGEFTKLLSRDSSYALGVDLSENLISQARKKYTPSSILDFQVADIVKDKISFEFDIISCMGVFTCLPLHSDFEKIINYIMSVLQPGGYLLLKDSLVINDKTEVYFNDSNCEALYRAENDYLQEFTRYGLKIEQRHILHSDVKVNRASILYLLHYPQVNVSPTVSINPNKVKLAILYQIPESWNNVRSVWLAAKKRSDIDIVIVLLPFLHQQLEWRRGLIEKCLQNEGIDYISWDEFDIADAAFDIVLFTSPYDSTRPKSFRFSELQQRVAITAYIPYGLEVGGGVQNLIFQYGQPVTMNATVVFARSLGVKKMFEKYCPTGSSHVAVTGHPRMDGLVNLNSFKIDPKLTEEIAGRKAILWNAHFSFDEDLWSTFDIFSFDIFMTILEQPELVLIFRPHPLLWKKLTNLNIFNSFEIEELKNELRALGVIVDERSDHRHAFAASSALMTDAGSFLLEYLVTRKPALYLCNSKGVGLNEQGEAALRFYHKALTPLDVSAFINKVSYDIDALMCIQEREVADFFYGFDGLSGDRVLEHLIKVYNEINSHE